jgi:hypothetical protein
MPFLRVQMRLARTKEPISKRYPRQMVGARTDFPTIESDVRFQENQKLAATSRKSSEADIRR